MLIREFRPGEEAALRAVFHSSVHQRACRDYSPAQLEAWAPLAYDSAAWAERICRNRPWVAELDGRIAGYADLQASGYIDQFFVAGDCTGRGVGSALMHRLLAEAERRRLPSMYAEVSLTAQAFFAQHGFVVEERRTVLVRGQTLGHARMRRLVADSPA